MRYLFLKILIMFEATVSHTLPSALYKISEVNVDCYNHVAQQPNERIRTQSVPQQSMTTAKRNANAIENRCLNTIEAIIMQDNRILTNENRKRHNLDQPS